MEASSGRFSLSRRSASTMWKCTVSVKTRWFLVKGKPPHLEFRRTSRHDPPGAQRNRCPRRSRGGVNSRSRWTGTLRELSFLRIDLAAIQEHNLRKDARGLNSIHFLANLHGFVFLFSPLPNGKRVRGVGILVKQETYAMLENPRFRSHRSGGLCTMIFRIHSLNMRFASVYAPADSKERVAFFRAIRSTVDESTILCGDFNCVDDPSLDTRRSSSLNYSND
eukprot:4044578-Pleurochrysis_carterae.AAC.1